MTAIAAPESSRTGTTSTCTHLASARLERAAAACRGCHLLALCPGRSADTAADTAINGITFARRRIRRGESLHHAGTRFDALYVVRTGFFKSYAMTEDGVEQVTGFQMAGDLLGLDGIESDAYTLSVRALEDSTVCVIPFAQLEHAAGRSPGLQRELHRLMSRAIIDEYNLILLLTTRQAEGRVVWFLLDLSRRFAAHGYAAKEFGLRMTREEIGSYLGLKLETVSRVFSRLQRAGLIDVQNRAVSLRDIAELRALAGNSTVRVAA